MESIAMTPTIPHILAFPYPAKGKGHIIPMLHFCNLLVSRGLKITMICTPSTMKSANPKALHSSINVETIPDTEYIPRDFQAYFRQFKSVTSKSLVEIIQKHQASNHPPTIVLYDSTLPWLLDVTHSLGLRGVSFFTQCASVCAVYYHIIQGTVKKSLEECNTVTLPAIPPLGSRDLPDLDVFLGLKEMVLGQFLNIDKTDCILFNTFQKLEDEVLKWMASQWPVMTIGPLSTPMSQGKKQEYLFQGNAEACLKWLDSREAGSVVYISFGSVISLSAEHMAEMAQGINNSNRDFLWVVKEEDYSKLPKIFKSETSDKGLITNWCPQVDVLAHESVACFVTHCGWNSTLEALRLGVPMIAIPQWGDETTNAKFITDVWETGVRVEVNNKGLVTSKEIERCIREVTDSEKGMALKRNAIKWKNFAKEAIEEGGSSNRNVEEFVSSFVRLM